MSFFGCENKKELEKVKKELEQLKIEYKLEKIRLKEDSIFGCSLDVKKEREKNIEKINSLIDLLQKGYLRIVKKDADILVGSFRINDRVIEVERDNTRNNAFYLIVEELNRLSKLKEDIDKVL